MFIIHTILREYAYFRHFRHEHMYTCVHSTTITSIALFPLYISSRSSGRTPQREPSGVHFEPAHVIHLHMLFICTSKSSLSPRLGLCRLSVAWWGEDIPGHGPPGQGSMPAPSGSSQVNARALGDVLLCTVWASWLRNKTDAGERLWAVRRWRLESGWDVITPHTHT